MAPTLIASYNVNSITTGSGDTTTLVTTSFTPTNGEVMVVKGQTWGGGPTLGAPTGGSQTYASRVTINPGGFACWGIIYTATISGSPGSMTVSMTVSASCVHSMTVERWGSAQLAATPATASASYSTASAPSATIATAANNSIVSWLNGDEQSVSPSGATYLSGATQDGLCNGSASANSVQYYAYQTAATAGSQTFGMSAPTGQKWTLAAIEVQSASTTSPSAWPPVTVRQAVRRSSVY